jgi:hypothetical protein
MPTRACTQVPGVLYLRERRGVIVRSSCVDVILGLLWRVLKSISIQRLIAPRGPWGLCLVTLCDKHCNVRRGSLH